MFFSGIVNAIDGSEDNQIHCFKERGPIPSGFKQLKKARIDEARVGEALEQTVDMEQDEENGYMSDTSIDLSENWLYILFVLTI